MDKTNPVSVAGYPERRLEVKETEASIHDITQSIFVSSEGGYGRILKRTSLTQVLLRDNDGIQYHKINWDYYVRFCS